MPTARPDAQLGAVLPTPPTAAREFATNEELTAYLEIYPGAGAPPATIDLTTSLVAADGRVAFRSEDDVSSEVLREAVNSYGWVVLILWTPRTRRGFARCVVPQAVEYRS